MILGAAFAAPNKGTMKKVNKQCLLDTPRTLRVSEKTWFEKISVESVQTKIINSFMHMFNVSTLYRKSIKLFHQKLICANKNYKLLHAYVQCVYIV